MSAFNLPPTRVYSKAFQERGRDDVVKIEVFPVQESEQLKLTFESQKAPGAQGVWMCIDGDLEIPAGRHASADFWYGGGPDEIPITCHTKSGCLHLYNIYDRGRGRDSQSWSSGMLVEDIPSGRRYRCNDVGFDTDFSRLVFRLERITQRSP